MENLKAYKIEPTTLIYLSEQLQNFLLYLNPDHEKTGTNIQIREIFPYYFLYLEDAETFIQEKSINLETLKQRMWDTSRWYIQICLDSKPIAIAKFINVEKEKEDICLSQIVKSGLSHQLDKLIDYIDSILDLDYSVYPIILEMSCCGIIALWLKNRKTVFLISQPTYFEIFEYYKEYTEEAFLEILKNSDLINMGGIIKND